MPYMVRAPGALFLLATAGVTLISACLQRDSDESWAGYGGGATSTSMVSGQSSGMPGNCSDGLQNGDETDRDCGGACPNKCADTKGCAQGSDCMSGACDMVAHTCSAPSCMDMVANGDETDKDCGGSCATAPPSTKCATGLKCMVDGDCIGGVCMGGTCQPSCTDKQKNQDETDVDCGGAICMQRCGATKACMGNSDCVSNICNGNICQSPTCMDTVQNQGETDVDCGGVNCGPCAPGKNCLVDADCTSNKCLPSKKCM